LFEELNHRHDSGALRGVDVSRIALAGFDLGAQTVMQPQARRATTSNRLRCLVQ
jgi:hypothetical protein